MTNTFNLQRFFTLFKKHMIENTRTYLFALVTLFGVFLLLLEFMVMSNDGNLRASYQAVVFITMLLLPGSMFTSLSFNTLGNKGQAIPTLTLPASHFEKYLVQWICTFVLFQLACVCIFYLADFIIISLHPGGFHSAGVDIKGVVQKAPFKNTIISVFNVNNDAYLAFIIFLFIHALTFWGAIFFDKLHFIKTAFLFFISLILLSLCSQAFLTSLIGRQIAYRAFPFADLSFTDERNVIYRINASPGIYILGIVTLFVIAILFWLSAFFRLKEKQI